VELIVLDKKNSILNHFLYDLRDASRQKDAYRFRSGLSRIGQAMAYEISQSMDYAVREARTPLGMKKMTLLADQPVLITIFRAGIPFFQGFLEFFDGAESGFLAFERIESQGSGPMGVKASYEAVPELKDKTVVVVDPMLATGSSICAAIRLALDTGPPKALHIASAIAAPEGVAQVRSVAPAAAKLWTASLDDRLDENAFIVPGLGDAGDLAFGKRRDGG